MSDRLTDHQVVGSMLAEWQALIALAEYAEHSHSCNRHDVASCTHPCTCGLNAARAALEEARNPK